jgi:hypothetical protein
MTSRQIGTSPGATRKSPRDMTGKLDEKQKQAAADALAEQAERVAMSTAAAVVRNSDVIDMTDEGRRARAIEEQAEINEGPVEVLPQKHRVRVLADIEDMVFGREVINPGDYSDPDNIVYPEVGSLRFYNFQEGREYIVDHDMYMHLKSLDYIWD